MKRMLLLLAVLALLTIPFVTLSYAAIGDYDFAPKDGDIDGSDLAQFAENYAAGDLKADVNGDGVVDSDDVADFAGHFGQTYSTRPPNILLIIADDVGLDVTTNLYPGLIDTLEAMYGSGVRGRPASIPNLTTMLATQGMVFSNTWAQPYCSPTRATVITGLFEDKTQVKVPDNPLLSPLRTFSFPKLLKDNGYSTAMIGKWHLAGTCTGGTSCTGTLPKQAGFDYYRGHNAAFIPGYWSNATDTNNNYPVHWQGSAKAENAFDTISAGSVPPRSLPAGTTPEIASTTYEPVVRAADTIDWINASNPDRNPDKPWFVWLAFNLSHVTVQNPSMHVPPKNMLDSATIAEMDACLPATPIPGQYGANPPKVGTCNGRQLMRAMTNAMDTAIGKVLDVVDFSNTYVIFIGDNGTPTYGNIGGVAGQIDNMYITTTNRGKSTPYESGCRVPMAIRGPNIAAGGQKSAPVHVADLFATILTLAGVTPPTTVKDSNNNNVASDSKSLTPILFGSANDTGRDPNTGYLLTEVGTYVSQPIKVGARNATYKVICNTSTSNANCTFYRLAQDPENPLLPWDPLEETPLNKPASCTGWTTANPEWHYCQLINVINASSIF